MFDATPEQAPTVRETASQGQPSRGTPIVVGRIFQALSKASRWLIGALVVGTALGVVLSRTVIQRQYKAEMTLVWEPQTTTTGVDNAAELKTLIESIKLPKQLEDVRHRLHLSQSIEALGKSIEVEPVEESHLVNIRVTASNAQLAASEADAIVKAFLDARMQIEQARQTEHTHGLTEGLDRARHDLANARQQWERFRHEHALVDGVADSQVALSEAVRLRAEADHARVEAQSAAAKAASLQAATQALSETMVLSRNETHPHARRLAELETELATTVAQLHQEHPRVQALTAQIHAIKRSRNNDYVATDRVVGRNPTWDALHQSLAASDSEQRAALARWSSLERLAANAERRLEQVTLASGRAAELLTEVHVAEARLTELSTGLATAQQTEILSASPGFRILTPARVPIQPFRSFRKLVIIATGPLLAFIVAFIVAVRCLWGLRIWVAEECAYWLQCPVLLSTQWPSPPSQISPDDIHDVIESMYGTRGEWLIVGTQSVPSSVVVEFSQRLRSMSQSEIQIQAWDAAQSVQALRRRARSSAGVLLMVRSGSLGALQARKWLSTLGQEVRLSAVMLGLPDALSTFQDRLVPSRKSEPSPLKTRL